MAGKESEVFKMWRGGKARKIRERLGRKVRLEAERRLEMFLDVEGGGKARQGKSERY